MQKKLIALAIVGAFAAPAFAATSNVDIYGKMHFSMNVYNDQPSNAGNEIDDIGFSSNASRIGFKGSEDLGGGLSAIWQVESTVNLDEGGGWGSGRNSFVGLSSKSMGTILGGKHDTPLKLVGRNVDLFGDTIADSRNVMGGGSDTRADNVVAYLSPDWSGFSFIAAYVSDLAVTATFGAVTKTTSGDREDADAYNLSAQYKNGPIYIGVGYGDGNYHDENGLDEHWRVAGSYEMGNFKIVGQYDSLDGNNDYEAWLVGLQYKTGNMVFKGNYMDGDYDTGTDPEQWTIGMDYNLSKRTSVYLMYVDGENVTLGKGASASDQVGYSAGVAGKDEDISAFSVGVVHSF